MESMRKCPYCAEFTIAESKICKNCGSNLEKFGVIRIQQVRNSVHLHHLITSGGFLNFNSSKPYNFYQIRFDEFTKKGFTISLGTKRQIPKNLFINPADVIQNDIIYQKNQIENAEERGYIDIYLFRHLNQAQSYYKNSLSRVKGTVWENYSSIVSSEPNNQENQDEQNYANEIGKGCEKAFWRPYNDVPDWKIPEASTAIALIGFAYVEIKILRIEDPKIIKQLISGVVEYISPYVKP